MRYKEAAESKPKCHQAECALRTQGIRRKQSLSGSENHHPNFTVKKKDRWELMHTLMFSSLCRAYLWVILRLYSCWYFLCLIAFTLKFSLDLDIVDKTFLYSWVQSDTLKYMYIWNGIST